MMMEILLPVLTVAGIHLLALFSPGPNFFISVKQGLCQPRANQIATTLGLALGAFVWIMLGFLGLSAVITQSVMLYSLLKLFGGAYLTYLGIKAMLSKPIPINAEMVAEVELPVATTRWKNFHLGLLTMMTNPKAAIYYLALFTSVIAPDTPLLAKVLLALVLPLISWCGYTVIAAFFSIRKFQALYTRFQRKANVTFGVLMIGLGLRIALDRTN